MLFLELQQVFHASILQLLVAGSPGIRFKSQSFPTPNCSNDFAEVQLGSSITVEQGVDRLFESFRGRGHIIDKIDKGLQRIHCLVSLGADSSKHKVLAIQSAALGITRRS